MSEPDGSNPARQYENFLVPALFSPLAKALVQAAQPMPGERVLDLACGTGIVSRNVAPLVGETGRVVAVDINPEMLAVARSLPAPGGAPVEWREGNAMALDLEDDSFDLALCQLGLTFFSDRPAALSEMRRVLSDGGRALLATWRGREEHPLYNAFIEAESRRMGIPVEELAVPFSCGDSDALRLLLTEAGFVRVQVRQASFVARFPSLDSFIESTLYAAGAVMPEFSQVDPLAFAEQAEAIRTDTASIIAHYRDGNGITIPMHAQIAVGQVLDHI